MKPLDIFQYYWEEYIINDYFRSDIKEITSGMGVKEIHKKISNQIDKILNNTELYEHSLKYFQKWPYDLVEYNIEQIVKDGVQYEVSENVTILEEENKVFLLNEKHKVPVPDKFSEMQSSIHLTKKL